MNDNVKVYRIKAWEIGLGVVLAALLVGLVILGLYAGGAKL